MTALKKICSTHSVRILSALIQHKPLQVSSPEAQAMQPNDNVISYGASPDCANNIYILSLVLLSIQCPINISLPSQFPGDPH